MAAIAQSDPYQTFMRKIGYSVGLENSLDRITDTAEVYAQEGHLSVGTWQRLVHETWGLKNDHIGDFFNALGLLNRSKTKVDALTGLDVFGILLSQFGRSNAQMGLNAAFLSSVIEHDGEIFLNCLAASFEDEGVKEKLLSLVEYKRHVLFDMFKSPETQAQIAKAVGIERQVSNIGGAGKQKTLSETKRTAPLEKRVESLRGPAIPPVAISDDYLRKVPPRRRDWAASIGLYSQDTGISAAGKSLLDHLVALNLVLPSGAVVLWPFSHEISRFRINPLLFEGRVIDYWSLVSMAIIGSGGTVKADFDKADHEETIELSKDQLAIFRQLNRPKAMLRREFPLTVAYVTLAAAFLVRGKPVPNIPSIIELERQAGHERIEVRSSRNSIGTIVVR